MQSTLHSLRPLALALALAAAMFGGGCALTTSAEEELAECERNADCGCGQHCGLDGDGVRRCLRGCDTDADCQGYGRDDRCGFNPFATCAAETGRCTGGCTGQSCGDTCCRPGETCVGGACIAECRGVTCDGVCCGFGDACVGGTLCCPSARACGDECCPFGWDCTAAGCTDPFDPT